MDINSIKEMINSGEYHFSYHAVKRMIERTIERIEVEEAVNNGEIIEEYPDDKYSPSCLIYGMTSAKRNLHVLVSLPPKVVIVTIYEPELNEWIDFKIRR